MNGFIIDTKTDYITVDLVNYPVSIPKDYRLHSFVDDVLLKHPYDRGYITVKQSSGDLVCYYQSEVLINQINDDRPFAGLMNRKIAGVRACGGWRRIDYEVTLQEE